MFKFRKKEGVIQSTEEISKELQESKKEIEKNKEEIKKLKEEKKFFLQNIGIVRFNPFAEAGGNQSFSLAFLNGEADGIVITSLYTKEGNRTYGKPIKKGKSEYSLSEEEEEAIKNAIKKK